MRNRHVDTLTPTSRARARTYMAAVGGEIRSPWKTHKTNNNPHPRIRRRKNKKERIQALTRHLYITHITHMYVVFAKTGASSLKDDVLSPR